MIRVVVRDKQGFAQDRLSRAVSNFREEIRPMFGHTPFNNYLFVFSRSSEGTTKV